MNAQQAPTDLPPELALLVACSRTELDAVSSGRLSTLVGAELDWQRVLSQARHHGMTPLVQRHLSRFHGAVPTLVSAELSSYSRNNAVHNLCLSHALLGILDSLDRKGIAATPYKGPLLASTAYGDVSLRSFKDLDVIVQPRDFRGAVTQLETLGYASTENDPRGHFHQSFVHTETGVMLELHHDVLRRSVFPTPLTVAELWPRLTEVSLLGRQVKSFGPEDTLLLLCLHGSSHAWQGLTWICDVAEYIRRHEGLEWEQFLRRAKRARLSRMALLGLRLAYDVLGTPLPEHVLSALNAEPKLQLLSQKILMRMCEQNAPGDSALTYQLQAQLRSGIWCWPLYGRLFTKRLRLRGLS